MDMRKPMTQPEKRWFKELVIREYKLKNEQNNSRNKTLNSFLRRLRSIIPLNIGLGILASIILVNFVGWAYFIQLMLSGIIWITLISTVVSAVVGKK